MGKGEHFALIVRVKVQFLLGKSEVVFPHRPCQHPRKVHQDGAFATARATRHYQMVALLE